ncbi:MAG: DNA adenine methylase, partial [Rugosibacter sp.]|nr:DNA adenine methylase [Rugosibacter sp.]
KGQGLYRNFYKHNDHLQIAKALQSNKFTLPWVVSYDNATEICDMYQISKRLAYNLNYTAQKRYVGNEVMFFSQKLLVPENEIPRSKLAA